MLGDGTASPDLAILVLRNAPNLSSKQVKIVNLPKSDSTCPKHKIMVTSGWGTDTLGGTAKRQRLWTVLQECLPMDMCGKVTTTKRIHLCVGDTIEGDNSAYPGDSGGNAV